MAGILEDWVLELKLASIDRLCPSRVFGVGKNPATVVLRLNNENAVSRHQNVINLRSSIAELQCDVIEQMKIGRLKSGLYGKSNKCFPRFWKEAAR